MKTESQTPLSYSPPATEEDIVDTEIWIKHSKGQGKDRDKKNHHLIVLLRLGWLTVLSSMNIVEQELYFLLRSPGDICKGTQMTNEARWRW